MPSLTDFGLAIRTQEGWSEGTRSYRNNNPGNLRNWDPSLPKDDSGMDIFPSYQAGWNALISQIRKNIFERKLTMIEFFGGKAVPYYGGFAPASDGNNPMHYASTVAGKLGVNPAVPLNQYQWTEAPGVPQNVPDTSGGSSGTPNASDASLDLFGPVLATLQSPVDLPYVGTIPAWQLLAGIAVLAVVSR